MTNILVSENESLETLNGEHGAYREQDCIYLLRTEEDLHPLIDISLLSNKQRAQLSSVVLIPADSLAFEGFLNKNLELFSQQLNMVARADTSLKGLITEPSILIPTRASNIYDLTLRSERSEQSIAAVTLDTVQVKFDDTDSDDLNPWTNVAPKAGTAGLVAGLAAGGMIELLAEVNLGFLMGSLLLVETLPIVLVATLIGVGVGLSGGPCAESYAKAIKKAKGYLDSDDYDNAAALLIKEHKRSTLERMTRALFLTKEHYAISHFFQAVCAEKKEQWPLAYSEYKQAYSDAKMANRMLMAFLANLHKLNVLLSMKEACLPNGRDRETELNNTLKRLTLEFEAGFADLYYKIHNNIKKLASWCLSKAAWDEQHLLVAKEFLSFDRFFLLKHFAKGEGELLQIVGVFFQGVLASVMEHRGKGKQADFKAASEKLQQTLTYLTGFKKSFVPPSLFSCSQRQKSTNMDKAIEFMEEFIIDFHAHGCAMDKNFEDIYNDLVKQLGIAQPDADLRLKQIKYEQKTLATLSRHFKQRFESLEEWLKALSDSNNSLISKISDTTGDTMLHLLVEMPLIKDALLPKVKELIPLLQQFSHTANQAKETPLSLLEAHDPYQLKNDLKIYALFQDAIKYERGEGRPKNYVMAAQCYQLAIDAGYTSAQQHLDSLLGLSDITAETLHTIGKMYYKGTGIQQVDYHKAKRCFEDASKKGSVVSDYNLGVMYRKGQGGPENFLKASQYYIRAAEQGYKPMDIQAFHDKLLGEQGFPEQHKKTQAKAFEKALITGCFLSTNDYPNTKDEQKNTLLHRVSQKKYYKYCARLIIFGANKDLRNTSGRVPFHVLSAHEQQKVSTLQNRLLNLRNNMNSPLEEVLAARVNVMGAVTDVTELRAMFKALDQLPEIHPLLALARLAALGLHDLANRTKFSNQAYDSDEDDNEVITDNKTLSFQYDAARDTVENLFHYGPDGQQGRKALGIYTFKNEIYMGGNRNSPALRGTTIHELTHFLAQEVFKNECNPYSIDDETAKGDFQKITDDIYSRRFTLVDRELQQIGQVFSYYNQNLWPSELIVRVPQIIVEHGDSGRQKLEKYVPSLLHFYNNQFLARVEEHTEKLKKRALSGWNERLFQAKEATIFRFEIENNTCGGLR